jgi:hypothetical protein
MVAAKPVVEFSEEGTVSDAIKEIWTAINRYE